MLRDVDAASQAALAADVVAAAVARASVTRLFGAVAFDFFALRIDAALSTPTPTPTPLSEAQPLARTLSALLAASVVMQAVGAVSVARALSAVTVAELCALLVLLAQETDADADDDVDERAPLAQLRRALFADVRTDSLRIGCAVTELTWTAL